MTIAELIELRYHQQDEEAKDSFYKGYAKGWQDAYDDMKAILEHYGFDMEQEVKKNENNGAYKTNLLFRNNSYTKRIPPKIKDRNRTNI